MSIVLQWKTQHRDRGQGVCICGWVSVCVSWYRYQEWISFSLVLVSMFAWCCFKLLREKYSWRKFFCGFYFKCFLTTLVNKSVCLVSCHQTHRRYRPDNLPHAGITGGPPCLAPHSSLFEAVFCTWPGLQGRHIAEGFRKGSGLSWWGWGAGDRRLKDWRRARRRGEGRTRDCCEHLSRCTGLHGSKSLYSLLSLAMREYPDRNQLWEDLILAYSSRGYVAYHCKEGIAPEVRPACQSGWSPFVENKRE